MLTNYKRADVYWIGAVCGAKENIRATFLTIGVIHNCLRGEDD